MSDLARVEERASTRPCMLCSSSDARAFWGTQLVQCSTCSLVRAADRFFEFDPQELYSAEYFSGAEYVAYRGERAAVRRNGQRRLKILQRFAPDAERLFEIGCAFGYFLELASDRWSSSGIEVSVDAAAEATRRSVPCVRGDYLTAPAVSPAPHIVCLWDTIEHLAAPRKVLEKIAAELAPGGVLALSTGDIGSWLPRVQRQRWRLIHPPTHLWYFSTATLTRLLQLTGFSVIHVTHPPFYRSLRLCVRRLASHLPERVGDWPVPMQTWDLMEIYARRCERSSVPE